MAMPSEYAGSAEPPWLDRTWRFLLSRCDKTLNHPQPSLAAPKLGPATVDRHVSVGACSVHRR